MINRMDEITALTTSSSLSHVTPEEKQYLQLLALAQLGGVFDGALCDAGAGDQPGGQHGDHGRQLAAAGGGARQLLTVRLRQHRRGDLLAGGDE